MATNLVSNAVKYGCGTRIEITVSSEGDEVRLGVRDHGIGIAPSDRGRIFERFERAHDGPIPGAGLGLYITREIVAAHGGRVAVDGAPGAGTVFTVTLPRKVERAQALPAPRAA